MVSTGKRFETRIKYWHRGIDCITFKLPDQGSCGTKQQAICDRVTITKTGVFWFECKHTQNERVFYLNQIKPHQLKIMLALEKTNNRSYFLIEDGSGLVYMLLPSFIKKSGTKKLVFSEISQFLINKAEFQQKITETFIY